MFTKLILLLWIHSSTGFIFNLNDTDYARLPPLYRIDSYEDCFDEPDSVFCFTEFVLVSDEPSELLTLAQKISESFVHFNHTKLRYGYCMKKTCSQFYNGSGTDVDLRLSLEACTNKTIYDKFKLKTRLTDDIDCSKRDRDHPIDTLDIVVAAVCILILLLNIVGSLCDRYSEKAKNIGALRYLYCFSIYQNWKMFTALPGEGRDSRIKALRSIHGIRSLSTYLVLAAHACFVAVFLPVDIKYIEEMMQVKFYSIFMTGSMIMQTFFIISSFLLVYNWSIAAEKEGTSLWMLPRQIIVRWFRLTPPYALILALTSTWFGRIKYGPYWKKIIYSEVTDCRREWWHHILYINNFYQTNCMPQAWYLACDTQLYIIGVIVFLTCKTAVTRKVVLSLLFLTGIIASILITYYERLHGLMVPSPETVLKLFIESPTFNKVYIKPYTNITGYAIGMALGYLIYNWQKNGGNPEKFQKYKYLYWSLVLMGCLCNFSSFIFFVEGPEQPIYVHMIYAAFMRPVFGTIVGLVVAGLVIRFEGFYRAIFEWRPFTYIGRLCYSAYLLHIAFVRAEVASITAVHRISIITVFFKGCTIVMGTFIAAFFFWMMVETPFANVTGQIFKKPATPVIEDKKEADKEIKKAEGENGTDVIQTQVENAKQPTATSVIQNPHTASSTRSYPVF